MTVQVVGRPLAPALPGMTSVTRPTPWPASRSRWLNLCIVNVLLHAVYLLSGRAS